MADPNYAGAMVALSDFEKKGLLKGGLRGFVYYGTPNFGITAEFTPSDSATEEDIKHIKETLESYGVPIEQKK